MNLQTDKIILFRFLIMSDESLSTFLLKVLTCVLKMKNYDLPYFQQSSLSKSQQNYRHIYEENSCSGIKVQP